MPSDGDAGAVLWHGRYADSQGRPLHVCAVAASPTRIEIRAEYSAGEFAAAMARCNELVRLLDTVLATMGLVERPRKTNR
ncbi:MAG TPA: hypothetical protein VGM37_01290 [Armatimonadota bacterium]|jgi:hypothetical protein